MPLCTTVAPSFMSPLITRNTEFSLPGIREEASTTRSPSSSCTWWSPLAMRDRAAIGSPWEPVTMSTISSSRYLSTLRMSTRIPFGTLR